MKEILGVSAGAFYGAILGFKAFGTDAVIHGIIIGIVIGFFAKESLFGFWLWW